MKINIERKKRLTEYSANYKVAYKAIRKFAFFPTRINNSQIVWLGWLYIVKEYNCRCDTWQDIGDAYDSYEGRLFTDKSGYKTYKRHMKLSNFYPANLDIYRR